jgi:hypothetical protein
MSVTPIRPRAVFKKISIAFLLLLLVFGSIHAFLFYKANSLFKAFVEQMSDGTYTASTEKLRFGYFPFRLKGIGVKFYPMDTTGMENQYGISSDTLELKLTSITPLLFYNSLQVTEVRLVNPQVELTSYGVRERRSQVKFNIPIKEIQNGLLKSLDLLQVDKCVIVDGGFSLMRADIKEKFAVNHINLTIDSLIAARRGTLIANGDTVAANITLSIDKPDIEIPDSNYLVDVARLFIDSRKNIFSIEELRFSRKKEFGAYDTIQLSSIELRGLNWESFLNEGLVELDSVRVKNGLAQVDLTDRFLFQKREGKKAGEQMQVDVPLNLHYVNIAQISYKLRSQRKTGPFTILLDGDSLQMSSFSMQDNSDKPIVVGSLSLNVRNYYDQDDKKTYVSGFDKLSIRDNDLDISNYRLVPLKREGYSANNRIDIPSLTLYNYDLGALLLGRLQADKLALNTPNIVLDILQEKGSTTKGIGLFNVLHRLQPTLDIKELAIKNATITLQPRNDLANSIKLSQLSTELNVEKLLSAASINDLMLVAEDIVSDGFFITGPRFEFKITNAEIAKGTEQLKVGKLQGVIANTLEIDLDSVTIAAKPGELLIPVDGKLFLERVFVKGGNVFVIGKNPNQNAADEGRKAAPEVYIDNIVTGPLKISYLNNEGSPLAIQNVSMDLNLLEVGKNKVQWASVFLKGNVLVGNTGNNNFRIGEWQGNLPGYLTLKNTSVWPSNPQLFGLTSELPLLRFSNSIQSIVWNPKSITNLEITNPKLRWNLVPKQQELSSGNSKPPLPLFLNSLIIIDPDIAGYRMTEDGEKRHTAVEAGNISLKNIDFFYSQSDEVKVGGMSAKLIKPVVEIDSTWTLKPNSIRLLASNLNWKRGTEPRAKMDTLEVDGIGELPVFKDAGQSLAISKAGFAGWAYPFALDSLIKTFTYGPDWWLHGVNYSLKGKDHDLNIYNASAFRKNRSVKFDSLVFAPKLERDSFWTKQPFEKDFISLKLGATEILNFRPGLYKDKDSVTQIETITTKGMQLLAARDKTRPDDTLAYRPMLAHQIMQIPFDFRLDTLKLENGRVLYQEIGNKFGQEGFLTIDSLSGNVYNMHSRPVVVQDSFMLDLAGKFMDVAPLQLQYAQSYFDTMQHFRFDVTLGKWPMSAVNTLLGPLNSIEFRRGFSDSMWLSAVGDKYRAYGWMGFNYEKMRMGILKDGLYEKYFLSGLINAGSNLLLLNNNKGNPTPFYTERLTNKATFNYWGKIMSAGLQGSIGVPGKKKSARKAMRKEDLPKQAPGR